jgi:hypothetical protein
MPTVLMKGVLTVNELNLIYWKKVFYGKTTEILGKLRQNKLDAILIKPVSFSGEMKGLLKLNNIGRSNLDTDGGLATLKIRGDFILKQDTFFTESINFIPPATTPIINLGVVRDTESVTVTNTNGTDARIFLADDNFAGVMSVSDKKKVNLLDPNDVMANALQIADLQGDRSQMVDGVVDPFDDESDIDLHSSSNQFYISTGGYYSTLREHREDIAYLAEFSASSEEDYAGAKNLNDGNFETYWLTKKGLPVPSWIKAKFHNGERIVAYSITSSKNERRMLQDWKFEASDDEEEWVTLDEQHNQVGWTENKTRYFSIDNDRKFKFYRIYILKNQGDTLHTMASEISLFLGTHPNEMTIVSEAFKANYVPTKATILVQAQIIGKGDLQKLLTAHISRNDGGEYKEADLNEIIKYKNGFVLLSTNEIDLTDIHVGDLMRYKLNTVDEYHIRITGVCMKWRK